MATAAHIPGDERGPAAKAKAARSALMALPGKPAQERGAEAPSEYQPRWPRVMMGVAGSLSLGVGVLVMAGWHTGHILSPPALWLESVPVRYNAGICLACGGVALLLLAWGKIARARWAAAPMAIIGLLTGCEYLLNLDFGIDELFFRSTRVAPSLYPRMAPNTAACLTLLGGVLLLARRHPKPTHNRLQAVAAGLAVAVGLVGFIGYAADIPTAYGWGRFTPMAAPTAALIVALGAGVIAFAWRQHAAMSPTIPPWSPLLAGVTLAAGSAALWQALHVLHPRAGLDVLALVVGLMQASLLYLVLRLLRSTRERARELRQLNSMLQLQMHSLERAERELHSKQAYTRSLIEASLDPLATIDPDGRITDVNAATEAVTGCSRQELIGTDFCDYFTDPNRARAGYQRVFREGGVRDYELELRHLDGHLTPVLYNASIYHDEAGQVIGVFAAARDISERKRLEEELLARQAYTRSLIEASLDPLVAISNQGKITDVNRAAEQATGMTRQELLGSEFCRYFTEPEKAHTAYQRAFAQGFLQGCPLALRHRSGQVIDVLYNASVFRNEAGEVEGVLAAARDISDRKRLEDSLRQRTLELENSVAELEAFSYSVSHDLRAPLRSIDGFSQILLEDYHQRVDKEGQDCLRRIRAASQNMGQLIDALLQLSRVMRGELVREPVDLSLLALSTAALIQKAEPSSRVRCHIANGLQVRGDRRLLAVVLQNLLQNAWKFTARNSEPVVEFGSTQKDGKTAYFVRDNGIGFDMTYVNKLFTPFQRLHAKEQFEGTGIGLATVQRVIKRHGGRVWAEGAVGKGATFYFSLE